MSQLERAGVEVREFVLDVMQDYRPDLTAAEVTVDVLVDRKPLKLNGYACAATVHPNSCKSRLLGTGDATITLDFATWEYLTEAQRVALIHHELTHIELQRDSDDQVKADAAGRPRLKMRLHDVQFGWFLEVARRHGAASYEVQQARGIRAEHGQLLFGWSDDMTGERLDSGSPLFGKP